MSRGGKLPQVQTFFVVSDHRLISITPVIMVTSLFVFDESLECWQYFGKPLVTSSEPGSQTFNLAHCHFPFKGLLAAFHFLL